VRWKTERGKRGVAQDVSPEADLDGGGRIRWRQEVVASSDREHFVVLALQSLEFW
jgi:hypothetical protein